MPVEQDVHWRVSLNARDGDARGLLEGRHLFFDDSLLTRNTAQSTCSLEVVFNALSGLHLRMTARDILQS